MPLLGRPSCVRAGIVTIRVRSPAVWILGGVRSPVSTGRRVVPCSATGTGVGSVGVASHRVDAAVWVISGSKAICRIVGTIDGSWINIRGIVITGAPDKRRPGGYAGDVGTGVAGRVAANHLVLARFLNLYISHVINGTSRRDRVNRFRHRCRNRPWPGRRRRNEPDSVQAEVIFILHPDDVGIGIYGITQRRTFDRRKFWIAIVLHLRLRLRSSPLYHSDGWHLRKEDGILGFGCTWDRSKDFPRFTILRDFLEVFRQIITRVGPWPLQLWSAEPAARHQVVHLAVCRIGKDPTIRVGCIQQLRVVNLLVDRLAPEDD